MNSECLKERLDPWFITGWFDGEGCFSVSVHKHPSSRFGWIIDPVVQTYQHKDSIEVLTRIKDYFQCGHIRPKGGSSNVLTYSVESRRDIMEKLIPQFISYPLQSRKADDFELFKYVVEAMERKEHREIEGFLRLVKMAFDMNPHGKNRSYLISDIESSLQQFEIIKRSDLVI